MNILLKLNSTATMRILQGDLVGEALVKMSSGSYIKSEVNPAMVKFFFESFFEEKEVSDEEFKQNAFRIERL